MRSSKLLCFKAFVSNGTSSPEAHGQVAIARKSYFSLPLIFEATNGNQHDMRIEFSAGNVTVPFALYFDQASEVSTAPNVSDRLNSAVSGSSLPEMTSQRSPRKTVIPFNTSKSSPTPPQTIHSIPADVSGVYTLCWDNSSSVVSTRQVVFHASFVKRAQPVAE